MFVAGNEVLSQRHSKKFVIGEDADNQHAEKRALPRQWNASTEPFGFAQGRLLARQLRLCVDLSATSRKFFRFFLQSGFDRFVIR